MHLSVPSAAFRSSLRAIALMSLVLSLTFGGTSSASAQTIPSDAKPTCTVTPSQFNSWFQSGHATVNGVVNPANSVAFPNSPNCSFYQWSKQMFLWLTSPAPSIYGGGAHVMDSPVFYDVSPLIGGKRTLIPHQNNVLRPVLVRTAQVGPHGLPVVVDTAGRLVEFRRAAPEEKPMIRSAAGIRVPLVSLTRDANLRLVPKDAAGKTIALAPRKQVVAKLPSLVNRPAATLFRINGIPILLDSTGNVVETEEGQAGGDGVLLTQGKSLIYYVTMVNDVYAYFLTMAAHQPPNSNLQFPTTQAQLNSIVAFAAAHSKVFPDPNALAIEVKSSWVRASTLPNNGAGYITMKATIPTYTVSSNNQTWTPNTTPEENVLLALVGMHVVGSTAGHPEMIWATFEHFGNAPDAPYQYINAANQTKTVPQSTAGTWLFTANNAAGPTFNVERAMVNSSNDIVAIAVPPPTGTSASNAVVPTDVLRIMAWGAQSNQSPNPLDSSAAASNTEIISIHNSVNTLMPTGDIRSNYFMTGATWTIGGANPTGTFPGGNSVGTSQISNSTMETFQQSSGTTVQSANCLDCHSNLNNPSSSTANVSISHDFLDIKPLF